MFSVSTKGKRALEEMTLLNSPQDTENQNHELSTPPPQKKCKMSKLFSFLDDPVRIRPASNCEQELEAYLNYDHLKSSDHTSALSFWRANADRFPKLSRLARKFLAAPATSAPVERVFTIQSSWKNFACGKMPIVAKKL